VTLGQGGRQFDLKISQGVPFGHKFSVIDIKKGQAVIKYGETIGFASEDIKAGQHVHIHNLEGARGRGDLEGGRRA
jgi:altronate dehydratase small subunit